jgi:hypothetical protein
MWRVSASGRKASPNTFSKYGELKTSYKLLYIEFKSMDPGLRQTEIAESAVLPVVT